MEIFEFKGFTFDSLEYSLTYRGQPVLLRPKAMKLLSLLLLNRDRVVSKAEIFVGIWGSEYARDHLLFQLISELRKAPFEPDFIRTQPNMGYQWNVVTRQTQAKVPWLKRSILAAGVVMACALLQTSATHFSTAKPAQESRQLPAYSALSNGVLEMHAGNYDEAERWFKFALRENPESTEASLFLAESLLSQGKLAESSQTLVNTSQRDDIGKYNTSAINDLLSRVSQRRGRLQDALQYAKASQLDQPLAQCSAEVVNERVALLEARLEEQNNSERSTVSAGNAEDISEEGMDECGKLIRNELDEFGCVPKLDHNWYALRQKPMIIKVS